MFTRKALAIVIASAAVLALVGLVLAQQTINSKGKRFDKKTELWQQKQEKARQEATLVQEGVITPKQKEHSKLYKNYKTGRKLRDLATTTGDVSLRRDVGVQGGDPNEASFDYQKFLQQMAGDADAVVVGTVKNRSSQLTEDEDYVFTDYELDVEEVLKNNAAAPIQTNSTITITRPGGTILLDGRIVEAIDESFQPFKKQGQYLLFLRFIPATGEYQSLHSKGSFQLSENKITKLTKESVPLGSTDATGFMNEVRLAIASAPTKRGAK